MQNAIILYNLVAFINSVTSCTGVHTRKKINIKKIDTNFQVYSCIFSVCVLALWMMMIKKWYMKSIINIKENLCTTHYIYTNTFPLCDDDDDDILEQHNFMAIIIPLHKMFTLV